ncbi:MgtC/SapB family protein [Simiduia curdlanivorans]|uniref:Protein MgtC n=1 Tax=Simiduia curdlanivorans TaxID=1492769 RepID=A0ABV8V503_9GAMM|nr:MgtC/SapB family protein [Simiduia curdlanivorans]MDN3640813.1 MgtC/SapB family protein [Simiduia curdlanivorans]
MMDLAAFFDIAPFDWYSVGMALLCGGVVGLERQLRGKPVGIRTSILIVLGTYIFIAASISVSSHMTDPSRIIGQVITGIGFLGAGVMLARKGVVVGVTSAAAIWVLASLGVCIAIGKLFVAFKFSLIVVFVLAGVDLLEEYSQAFSKGVYRKVKNLIGNGDKLSDD